MVTNWSCNTLDS